MRISHLRAALLPMWLAAITLVFGGASAYSQEKYPNRPINFLIGYPAGGSADTLTRLLAEKLQEQLGTPVMVDNKPGGSTIIAVNALLQSKPDGYTFQVITNDTVQIIPHMMKVSYDPATSFEYVALFGEYEPSLLAARIDLPVSNAKEAVEYLKKNTTNVRFASHGIGSTVHLRMELLLANLGIKVTHVPYKGSAPAMIALAGGHVDMIIDSPSTTMPLAEAGKVKVIANTGRERSPRLPNVMTLQEVGAPGTAEFSTFLGIVAPKGTPEPVVRKMAEYVRVALQDENLRAAFEKRVLQPKYVALADFRSMVLQQGEKLKKIIVDNDIKIGN